MEKIISSDQNIHMNEWTPVTLNNAEFEIRVIMQNQNPTGRTDGENNYYEGLIQQMNNREITPAEAILRARAYGDSRQDGHGAGIIQDGY